MTRAARSERPANSPAKHQVVVELNYARTRAGVQQIERDVQSEWIDAQRTEAKRNLVEATPLRDRCRRTHNESHRNALAMQSTQEMNNCTSVYAKGIRMKYVS
jgi:hypothetical protein